MGGCHPTVPPTALPSCHAGVPPPPPMYPGALPPAPRQQHPQAVRTKWGAQEGKGEEHSRAWPGVGGEDRRLQESEARVMREAAGATEAQTRVQSTIGG